jgi:poly(A) polymerase
VLEEAGIEARFVGGCVRDAFLGIEAEDYDVAANGDIESIVSALEIQRIRCNKSGIRFWSTSAVVNNVQFQITSLRTDHSGEGRYCRIERTSSFEEDARRRDFTINAIYVDKQANVYDYFGGIDDIKSRDVKFIGDPKTRIQEDYIRIFRYYRMCEKLGCPPTRYQDIIKEEIKKIRNIKAARIQKEISKLEHYKLNL